VRQVNTRTLVGVNVARWKELASAAGV
jgi:hypothetical protein